MESKFEFQTRESDGRFAVQMKSEASVKRWMKRDAEREARTAEIKKMVAGNDELMPDDCWA